MTFLGILLNLKETYIQHGSTRKKFFKIAFLRHLTLQQVEEPFLNIYRSNISEINSK